MNILITAPYDDNCRAEIEKSFGNVFYFPWKEKGAPYNQDQLLEMLNKYDIDGLITELDEVNQFVIEHASNLKFIGVCRANPVNVDLEAANQHQIPVFNTPARNAQAVTEILIGSLISFYRNIGESNSWLKDRKWNENNDRPYLMFRGNEIAGKTVGFVGFGAVGSKVANILKEFPCNIQYYDPFVESNEHYEEVSLEDLFKTSDIVSIHLPVNESTKGLIDAELLNSMMPNSVLVNTARAAVIDQQSLYTILKEGKICGAILDVFENEPPLDDDYNLIELSNVLATPHIAGASYEVEDHHSYIMNRNINKYFLENEKNHIFNKDILKR